MLIVWCHYFCVYTGISWILLDTRIDSLYSFYMPIYKLLLLLLELVEGCVENSKNRTARRVYKSRLGPE